MWSEWNKPGRAGVPAGWRMWTCDLAWHLAAQLLRQEGYTSQLLRQIGNVVGRDDVGAQGDNAMLFKQQHLAPWILLHRADDTLAQLLRPGRRKGNARHWRLLEGGVGHHRDVTLPHRISRGMWRVNVQDGRDVWAQFQDIRVILILLRWPVLAPRRPLIIFQVDRDQIVEAGVAQADAGGRHDHAAAAQARAEVAAGARDQWTRIGPLGINHQLLTDGLIAHIFLLA